MIVFVLQNSFCNYHSWIVKLSSSLSSTAPRLLPPWVPGGDIIFFSLECEVDDVADAVSTDKEEVEIVNGFNEAVPLDFVDVFKLFFIELSLAAFLVVAGFFEVLVIDTLVVDFGVEEVAPI